jgi:hypothetical protein
MTKKDQDIEYDPSEEQPAESELFDEDGPGLCTAQGSSEEMPSDKRRVNRLWSHHVKVLGYCNDLLEFMKAMEGHPRRALSSHRRTPEKLEILKKIIWTQHGDVWALDQGKATARRSAKWCCNRVWLSDSVNLYAFPTPTSLPTTVRREWSMGMARTGYWNATGAKPNVRLEFNSDMEKQGKRERKGKNKIIMTAPNHTESRAKDDKQGDFTYWASLSNQKASSEASDEFIPVFATQVPS